MSAGGEVKPRIELFQWEFEELCVLSERVEAAMGYESSQIPSEFREIIERILGEAPRLCRARGGYRIISDIEVDRKKGKLSLDGKKLDAGKIVTAAMMGSESIAVMACTAGQGVTDRSHELFEQGDLVAAHVLDTIGSVAVERIADLLQAALERETASIGKSVTNRYSPGYCMWPVSDQHRFFSLLPENFCGISLTESALMVPLKSVSAIVGIGENVSKRPYECDTCDQRDCIIRRPTKG